MFPIEIREKLLFFIFLSFFFFFLGDGGGGGGGGVFLTYLAKSFLYLSPNLSGIFNVSVKVPA